jgi:cobalt-zinc-cadmium resistance protein CzcA
MRCSRPRAKWCARRIYGQAIIFLVFAPLLTFTGVEGKMFSPMAITVMLALAGAFIRR